MKMIQKEIARDLKYVIDKAFIDVDKKSLEFSRNVTGLNFTDKRYEVENYMKADKRRTFNEALNLATKGSTELETKNIIQVLSTAKAFNNFVLLLRDEQDKLSNTYKIDQEEISEQPEKVEIKWTNGNNKTDFVKLIYGFHKAKLINNGKGDITKIVESLGHEFNVELGKGWQSNLSKNKNVRNNDYDSLEIFDRIKSAYESYLKEKNK